MEWIDKEKKMISLEDRSDINKERSIKSIDDLNTGASKTAFTCTPCPVKDPKTGKECGLPRSIVGGVCTCPLHDI